MRASKAGGLRWAIAWVSLGVLAGCQVVFGVDPDALPAQDAMGGGSGQVGGDSQGGGSGQAGGGQAGDGQAGDGQAGGGRAGGGQGGGGGQAGSAGGLSGPAPILLASGAQHTCVRDQGVARCWGYNYFGQLGTSANNGTENPTPVPTLVAGLPPLVP